MLSFPEVNELSDEVRRVFEELDRAHGATCRNLAGIHTPLLDVVVTSDAVEVFVDLPGVDADAMRVLFKHGSLVIAGEKVARDGCGGEGTAFHLAERSFGRFARVLRLDEAIDAGRARAVLRSGELRVSVPRIGERRGVELVVGVDDGRTP
jgi:HSP20 family protein